MEFQVGQTVLCPYRDNHFPGTIVDIKTESRWFGLVKQDIALVRMELRIWTIFSKQWENEVRYIKIPVKELAQCLN